MKNFTPFLLFIFLFCYSAKSQLLTQNFESGTFPPTGWTISPATGSTWEQATNGALGGDDANLDPFFVNPHAGAGMAQFRAYDFSSGTAANLVSSSISLVAVSPKLVSFWLHQDNGYSASLDSVVVYINTSATHTGATRLGKAIRPIPSPAQQWTQFSFNIPITFNTATNFIIFRAFSRFGNNLFLDDISVQDQPSCQQPTALVNSPIGTAGATHSWTAASGSPTGYEWAVTTSSIPPASGTATVATTVNSTGLSPITNYFLHVRTSCGAIFSAWSSAPFTTSFDCSTATTIAACGVSQNAVIAAGVGSYNITSCGFSTPGLEKLYAFTPTVSGLYTLNITAVSGTAYVDYFYKEATVGCAPSGWTCIDDNNAAGTDVFGPLTAGVTYYILLDLESDAGGANQTFQIDCPSTAPACVATYVSPSNNAINVTYQPNVVFSWNNVPGATLYDIYLDAGAPPTIPTTLYSDFAPDAGATTTLLFNAATSSTQYVWYVVPKNTGGSAVGCSGNVQTFTTAVGIPPPPNDAPCNAINLVLNGAADCKNTAFATATGDPSFSCSTPNNTVWYTYTPAASGLVQFTFTPPASGDTLQGWLGVYTSVTACPGLVLDDSTSTTFGSCTSFGDVGQASTVFSKYLTAGTKYYFMIDGVSGDIGQYCFSIQSPPLPPVCTANSSPAAGAVNVPITAGAVNITWNAAAGATAYDIYFGSINPPTANIGTIAAPAVTANVTGLLYDSTYYFYIVPKNGGGSAAGCSVNTTSFTVQSPPPNCIPLTTSGCSSSDRIELFRLKGESSELNINTGTQCAAGSYIDSTDHPIVIDLARGKSYWGQTKSGTTGDYLTVWIDANDNGFFENAERLLNNTPMANSAPGNINIFIPLSTPAGNHKLRARLVYYNSTPTAPSNACGNYTYSDTRDFTVNIVSGGSVYTVSNYTSAGACYTGGGNITIDAASNNNIGYVPLVDSSNALIAQLYPQGNNLGVVRASYFKNVGAVRQSTNGIYYLDRNLTITVSTPPTGPYNLRYPYLLSELNALIAQPGSGVTSQFDLSGTKNNNGCLTTVNTTSAATLFAPTGFGSISGDRFVDVTGLTGFSSFYLHGGSTVLPVTIEYFKGNRQSGGNLLDWKVTCTGMPYVQLILEKSNDGVGFNSINEETATATRCLQGFNYVDQKPFNGYNYYRLKTVSPDGKVSFSTVVVLLNTEKGFEIISLAPNPVKTTVLLNITSAKAGKIDISIIDLAGKLVRKTSVNGIAGYNSIRVDCTEFSAGTYFVMVKNTEGDLRTSKFVKY